MGLLSVKDLQISEDFPAHESLSQIKTSIDGLIRVACNHVSSMTLRDIACEQLSRRVGHNEELARYAAAELFANHKAGFPAEPVFDALIRVIYDAQFSSSAVFRDAIEAATSSGLRKRVKKKARVPRDLAAQSRKASDAA